MGWVDREGGVIELLDRSSTEAGVYATIACEDAAEVAQALIAALPPLEGLWKNLPTAATPMPEAR